MKKILVFFLFLTVTSNLDAGTLIPADNPSIQYFGRWDFSDPKSPSHSWPGVYIYAEFEGTSIGVKLKDNYCYFNVYIDGEFVKVFRGDSDASKEYTLVTGLSDSSHTILFSKRNETNWTRFYFEGFIIDEGKSLLPPKARPVRKIEFIGNSATSASGNEYHSPGSAGDSVAFYTNIDKGFGPIVARHYDAQYHMTSVSGWGVVLDCCGGWNNIPDVFDQTHIHIPNPVWDFEQWIPNVAVIALGSNDYNGFGGWDGDLTQDETDLFKERYHQFISMVNDVYPGVKILAVATHLEWIRETVSEIVEEENVMGHDNVFYGQRSFYEGGYVHNGHPNVATHDSIAQELISYIDQIEPWEAYIDTLAPKFDKLPQSPATIYQKEFELVVETDSYATVRFSDADKSYEEMEHTFTTTGKRRHAVVVSAEHGDHLELYLRAADLSGNAMSSSAQLTFDIDTTKKVLNWTDIEYDDSDWKTGQTPIGFGDISGLKTESDSVITLYVRRAFTVDDTTTLNGLGVLFKGQDGIVLYLNGTEVGRENFFDGEEITYSTYAFEVQFINKMFIIDQAKLSQILIEGENLLAAEIHIAKSGSDGVHFEAQTIDDKFQIIIPFESEWQYFDAGSVPEDKIVDISTALINRSIQPEVFRLSQNYPNPFNPLTKIKYSLAEPVHVHLEVFDIKGSKISDLVNTQQHAGEYTVEFDGSKLSSGLYFYRLKTDPFNKIKRMLIIK